MNPFDRFRSGSLSRLIGFGRFAQRGNVFAMLFAAVALTGVLAAVGMQTLTGPVTTITRVTQKNIADNNLLMDIKILVSAAVTGTNGGDADTDGIIEPAPFVAAGGGESAPSGGGFLPTTLGLALTDPWGTKFGYCVWDHGTTHASANRIGGDPTAAIGQPTIVIVSAGPDKTFQTTCPAFSSGVIAVNKAGGADDLLQKYTYAEASASSNGLWQINQADAAKAELKNSAGDPAKVSINRDTGIGDFLGILTSSIVSKVGELIDVGGALKLDTAGASSDTCDAGAKGAARLNAAENAIELCDGNGGWIPSAAPKDATYITRTPNADLTSEQALSALGTGPLKVTTGTGVLSSGAIDLSSTEATGTLADARFPALTGDVTTTAGAVATTIATNAVTNAKLAQVAPGTLKGNNTTGVADPSDLTGTEVTAMLDVFGISGASASKGLVPSPGSSAGNSKYLREDGTWGEPAGTFQITDGDKGDVLVSGSGGTWLVDDGSITTSKLFDDAVTFAKFQNITTDRLLGRGSSGTGDVEEITMGLGLSITGGALTISTLTGSMLADDSIDFTELTDNMLLDASTNIGVDGSNVFSITNTGTGNSFVVNDEASDTTSFVIDASGNIGVGLSTPALTAILDVASTTKGFLPPRMTTTQRDAIVSPAAGLIIYNTTSAQMNIYTGSAWAGVITGDTALTVAGNDGSIQFKSGSNLAADPAYLHWDATNHRLGLGTITPSYQFDNYVLDASTSGSVVAANNVIDLNPSANTSGTYRGLRGQVKTSSARNYTGFLSGIYGVGTHQGNGNVSTLNGVSAYTDGTGAGVITNMYGVNSEAHLSNGTATNMIGVSGRANTYSFTTVANAVGVQGQVIGNNSSATFTSAKGLEADLNLVSGTATNYYGLYVNDEGTSNAGYYSIYTGATKSYFGGQVGIGAATPEVSAALDVSSTTKGFLPPRMTTAQVSAIGTPANGLLVYDTDLGRYKAYQGGSWQEILTSASGNIVDDSLDFDKFKDAMTLDASTDIAATGTNELSITNSGTGKSFIVNDGTADTTPFVIDAAGKVGIGTTTPTTTLSFSGDTANIIGTERMTTTNTAGSNLTLLAGGATSGATDKAGGDLILSSGQSTGTGSGSILFKNYSASTTNTTDNALVNAMTIKDGKVGIGTLVPNSQLTLVSGAATSNGIGFKIQDADTYRFFVGLQSTGAPLIEGRLPSNGALTFAINGSADTESYVARVTNGRFGIGNNGSTYRTEISGTWGSGYLGISSSGSSRGDILSIRPTGNIGMGVATPDASAKLDLSSTTQGFLPPRMTTAQVAAIATPANGLLVYDSDLGRYKAYQGSAWQDILTTATGNIADDALDFDKFKDSMTLDASTDVLATGTNVFSHTNTGTGNSFVVNDDAADTTPFVIDAAGNVGIGTSSPSKSIHILSTSNPEILIENTTAGGGQTTMMHLRQSQTDLYQSVSGSVGTIYGGSGDTLSLVLGGSDTTNQLVLKNTSGYIGMGTFNPNYDLSFGGQVARTFGMERHTTSNTAGNNLTIRSSGATLAATDKNGGDLVLSSGVSTGTGSSGITFNTYAGAASTGTADNAVITPMVIKADSVGIGTTAPTAGVKLHVVGTSTTVPALKVEALSGSSNSIQQWVSSDGVMRTYVGSSGSLYANQIVASASIRSFIAAGDGSYVSRAGRGFVWASGTNAGADAIDTGLTRPAAGVVAVGNGATMGDYSGTLVATRAGLGTATPNASAALDITSTTQGFLPPRLTTAQVAAISTPAEGLLVYDTDLSRYKAYQGGSWYQILTSEAGNVPDDSLDFDKFKDAMTLDASTSIAATGANELSITNTGTGKSLVVNDDAADTTPFVVDASGNVGIGTSAPASPLSLYNADGTIPKLSFMGLNGSSVPYTMMDMGVKSSGQDYGGFMLRTYDALNSVMRPILTFDGKVNNSTTTWNFYNGGGSVRLTITNNGNIGFGVSSPNYSLAFGGAASRTIGMERGTANATAGFEMALSAGAPKALQTDQNGGDLTLSSGTSIGAGSSNINFKTAGGGTTGTADRTAATTMILTGTGKLGIGTTTPNASALVDITSTTQGFLPPRMTTAQVAAIATPAEGLLVYDTDLSRYKAYQGGAWYQILTTEAGNIANNSLDFDKFKDAMTLDASTDIAATGTNVLSISNTGTGKSFVVNDEASETTPFVIDASGTVGIGIAAPNTNTKLQVVGSVAVGYSGNTANGANSLSVGYSTAAGNQNSFAQGYQTQAAGWQTVALGQSTTATALSSVAAGTFNIGGGTYNSWVATDPLFEVGIGTDSSHRTDAFMVLKNGKIGMNVTAAPTNDLSFGGDAARTINVERTTTSSVAGNSLTIQAGGAKSAQTDQAGGDLILSSGQSTGTGTSKISFKAFPGATSTGSADNTAITAMTVTGAGLVGIGTASPARPLHLYSATTLSPGIALEAASTGGRRYDLISTAASSGQGVGKFLIMDSTLGTRFSIDATGQIGINTQSPSMSMGFAGNAAQQIGMERGTVADTAGNNLTLQAGGATSAATDKAGGSLILSSGQSTGTGTSQIQFKTFAPAASTATTDNTAATRMTITEKGLIGFGTTPTINFDFAANPTDYGGATNGSIMRLKNSGNDSTFMMIDSASTMLSGINLSVAGSRKWSIANRPNDGHNLYIAATAASNGGSDIASAAVLTLTQAGAAGIGTASPNASAALDVASTTKGFLPPRMTTAQVAAIATPANGLLVYDTDLGRFKAYQGGNWYQILTNEAGNTPDDSLDFDKFKDAMALDASTDIAASGTNELSITNTGTGKSFVVNDDAADTTPFAIDAAGNVAAGGNIGFTATATAPTTGIYSSDGTSLNISTGGLSRMVIAANGAVGIGSGVQSGYSLTMGGSIRAPRLLLTANSTPDLSLTMMVGGGWSAPASGTEISKIVVQSGDGTTPSNYSAIRTYVDGTVSAGSSPGRLVFQTVSSGSNVLVDRMRIDSAGNVGIGTVASGTYLLSLGGDAARTIGVERTTVNTTAGSSLTVQAGGTKLAQTDQAGGDLVLSSGTSTGTGGSAISFKTATPAASTATADNAPSTKMTITGAGKVGINTVAPTQPLSIVTGAGAGTGLDFKTTDADPYSFYVGLTTANAPIIMGRTPTNGSVVFSFNGNSNTESFVARNTTGRFGIGDSSVAYKAEVFSTYTNGYFGISTSNASHGDIFSVATAGNIGIGNATPNASALLDLTSTTRGFLPPRMTTAQRVAIATPANGLLVYDTDTGRYNAYQGGSWQEILTNATGNITDDSLDFDKFKDAMALDASTDISVTGTNVLSVTNTGTANSFVVNDDTADTSPFIIDAAGKVGIGTTTLQANYMTTVSGGLHSSSAVTGGNGVYGENNTAGGIGMYGYSGDNTTGSHPYGVYGYAAGVLNYAVGVRGFTYGTYTGAAGVFGSAAQNYGGGYGVHGDTSGAAAGVYGNAYGTGNTSTGVLADNSSATGWSLKVTGTSPSSFQSKVGFGTTAPSTDVALGGNTARTIGMERHTTADTAGNALTIQAGGATAAATDKAGGDLILASGQSTGTGSGSIVFKNYSAGTTAATDNAAVTAMTIKDGKVGIGTSNPTTLLSFVTGATQAGLTFRTADSDPSRFFVGLTSNGMPYIDGRIPNNGTVTFQINGNTNAESYIGRSAGDSHFSIGGAGGAYKMQVFAPYDQGYFGVSSTTGTQGDILAVKAAGNVGVGNSSPNASALLDLTSTTRGFLPPRMTTAQVAAIATPANGLLVYDSDTNRYNAYQNGSWQEILTNVTGNVTDDSLDFDKFKDAMALDASTDISVTGTNVLSVTNTGTGNTFVLNDDAADTTPLIVDAAGNLTIGTTAAATATLDVAANNAAGIIANFGNSGLGQINYITVNGLRAMFGQDVTHANLQAGSAKGIKLSVNSNTFGAGTVGAFIGSNGNFAVRPTVTTSDPTYPLSFGGGAAQTIGVQRHPSANTAGNSLTILGGGAYLGATDKNGGNLILSSGTSTGTGSSNIQFQVPTAAGSTATTDNTPATMLTLSSTGANVVGDIQFSGNLKTAVIGSMTPVYIRGSGTNHGGSRLVKVGNTTLLSNGARGLTLCILTASTRALVGCTAYDTYASSADSDALATALNDMPRTQIGILTSWDAWEVYVNTNLRTAAKRLGLIKLAMSSSAIRTPYASIFYGSGTSTANTETSRQVIELGESNATGANYAVISTWISEDAIEGASVPSALLSPYGAATEPGVAVDYFNRVGIGTSSPTSNLHIAGGSYNRNAWTTIGPAFFSEGGTYVDTTTAASGTVATRAVNTFGSPTLDSTNAITVTNASTVYIGNAPAVGAGNTTITNALALHVAAGKSAFGAGVSIGTTALDASAMLDVTSTTKGFLPPRMTTAQVTAVSTPSNGLMVYDTDTNALKLRANGTWVSLATTASTSSSGTAGYVQFSNGTGGFSSDSTSGDQLFWDSSAHRLGLGTAAPASLLHIAEGSSGATSGAYNTTFVVENSGTANNYYAMQVSTVGGGAFFNLTNAGNVGIRTTAPSYALSFGGTAARTIGMERNTTADTGGQGFSLLAGGATVGSADKAGGNLTLSSGIATGLGSSSILFKTSAAGAATGTTDNALGTPMVIVGNNVGIGDAAPGSRLTVAQTSNLTTGDNYMTYNNLSVVPGADTDAVQVANFSRAIVTSAFAYNGTGAVRGANNRAENYATGGTLNSLVGSYNDASVTNNGSTTNYTYGAYNRSVTHNNSTIGTAYGSYSMTQAWNGTITNGVGVYGEASAHSSTSTMATAKGVYGRVEVVNNGTITTAKALEADLNPWSGTVGSYYGLYINDEGTANANWYSIYTGTTKSYFGGNVGIGDTAPSEKLVVAGNIKATAYLNSSDRRLKDKIEDLDGLSIIRKLHGVSFVWKATGKEALGLIAQEVEEVLPFAVATDSKGYKAVDYIMMIAPMIESIKSLDSQVTVLRAENAALKSRVETLEGTVKSLEERLKAIEEKLGATVH